MSSDRLVVAFVGPSISESAVRRIAPTVRCLPPARCGDVVSALRLSPDALVLIDGYYERTPSVWHKELLHALGGGVEVIGASSMGALRAAELEPLGMRGIGAVFEEYRQRRLLDDDEVALVHSSDFVPLSDPMVNIRATLARAVAEGALDEAKRRAIEARCKSLYYADRSLRVEAARVLSDIAPELQAPFARWLRSGYVDIKRQDAEAAIRASLTPATAQPSSLAFAMTVPFRALLSRIGCRAFPYYRDWLPARERTLCKVRLIGPLYRALRECAAWFSIADTLAAADGVTIDEWLGSDGDPRLVRMLFALTQRDARLGEDASAPLLRLVEAALSRLVLGVRRAARHAGLVPTAEAVQLALDGFRQRRALLDQAAALAWAAEWSLSASDLAETMELELLRGALVLPGRADLVGDHPPLAPRHWLSEVWDWLRLEPLWRSIDRPRELGWLAERYRCVSEGEANERDFADGLGGYQLDAAAMAS